MKIYRLITRNSYEREMFDKASMKLGLDKAVLQSMRGENQSAPSAVSTFLISLKPFCKTSWETENIGLDEFVDKVPLIDRYIFCNFSSANFSNQSYHFHC